ncbi:hypothetical protein QCA50_019858 [Cerrena zonata]|uniref:DNA-directed RNA polymerase C-terminal domain-containing protein n=1 Tax=Cerrena zonata TaxID=2478898 RepID=A0AAW0FED7_9APHY
MEANLEEDEEPSAKKKAPKPSLLDDKFIEMTELLPPVPKKGVFDVDRVKNSLYFFS